MIYTTNAIESVNAQLRKIIKTRGHFPSDEAATKLMWLALRNITAEWRTAGLQLEISDEPVRDPLRGSVRQEESRKIEDRLSHRVGRFVASADRRRGKVSSALHTKIRTLPGEPLSIRVNSV